MVAWMIWVEALDRRSTIFGGAPAVYGPWLDFDGANIKKSASRLKEKNCCCSLGFNPNWILDGFDLDLPDADCAGRHDLLDFPLGFMAAATMVDRDGDGLGRCLECDVSSSMLAHSHLDQSLAGGGSDGGLLRKMEHRNRCSGSRKRQRDDCIHDHAADHMVRNLEKDSCRLGMASLPSKIAVVHLWVAAFDLLPAIYLGLVVDLNQRDGRAMVGHYFCPNLGVMRKGKSGPEMDGGCAVGCDLDESDVDRDPAAVLAKAAPHRQWRKWGPGVAAATFRFGDRLMKAMWWADGRLHHRQGTALASSLLIDLKKDGTARLIVDCCLKVDLPVGDEKMSVRLMPTVDALRRATWCRRSPAPVISSWPIF
ncbi:hypothetical protein ACLOJK_014791 [Asimina triloba]